MAQSTSNATRGTIGYACGVLGVTKFSRASRVHPVTMKTVTNIETG